MNETQEQINKLQAQISELQAAFYKNNFSAYQAFNKASEFSTSLKIPVYTTLPSCEVGQICVFGGKLYVASATNTWTVAGTQS
jgi:hypothetical protein